MNPDGHHLSRLTAFPIKAKSERERLSDEPAIKFTDNSVLSGDSARTKITQSDAILVSCSRKRERERERERERDRAIEKDRER
jgi:hypothetical protein